MAELLDRHGDRVRGMSPRRQASFWRYVDRTSEDGCWPWLGGCVPSGYGSFSWRVEGATTTSPAHRVAYELLIGPIPPDLHLDHTCHDPAVCGLGDKCPHRPCVNPAHLEPVTAAENARRAGTASPWQLRKTHCPAGHPYSGDNLRVYGNRRQCVACVNARNNAMKVERATVKKPTRRDVVLSFFAQNLNHNSGSDCNFEQEIVKRRGAGRPRKTHCHRGHPLVEPNLVFRRDGQRACLACVLGLPPLTQKCRHCGEPWIRPERTCPACGEPSEPELAPAREAS